MTTSALLKYLRTQFLRARLEGNEERLSDLEKFNKLLLEAAYALNASGVASVLEEFEDSFRDSSHGVEWKSRIPTEKEIDNIGGA